MNDLEELADFLDARVAEDEAAAHAAIKHPAPADADTVRVVWYRRDTGWIPGASGEWSERQALLERFDPTRVLAECAAKRQIAAHLLAAIADEARAQRGLQRAGPDNREAGEDELAATRTRQAVECIAKHVAQVYADHEQFREEWQE